VTDSGGHADTAYLLDTSGPAAPPRDNGELTFAAPWESRAFGVALALRETGRIDWEDFRQLLIAEIGDWQDSGAASDDWSYYACWLRALERLVSQDGLVAADDLETRVSLLAARPPDHGPAARDHDHGPQGRQAHASTSHAG